MPVALRGYQEEFVGRIRGEIRMGFRRILGTAPTGSGKTVCFSYMVSRVAEKGRSAVIVVHRDELLQQVSRALSAFNVDHGFIAAGYPDDRRYRVRVASAMTLVRRAERIRCPDLLIIDEAHHAAKGTTWAKIAEQWSDAVTIGVTATPERLDGKGLDHAFDRLVIGPTVAELIETGNLSPYRMFCPSAPDLFNVKTRMGDYAQDQLGEVMDTQAITGNAVAHYRQHARGTRALAFCVSIAHCTHVRDQFHAAGISSEQIDGGMQKAERARVIRDFTNGDIQVLTSCNLVSEGFDLPALQTAILLRPTQSLALYLQQVGRALRPYHGKEFAVILDHAGNAARHGLPDDERSWRLEGRSREERRRQSMATQRVSLCDSCFAAMSPTVTVCPFCGVERERPGRVLDEREGQLREVDLQKVQRARKREQGAAQSLDALIRLGRERGYKNPERWARHVYEARQRKRLERAMAMSEAG